MRILMASAFFESHGVGVKMFAGALARAMVKRGHDIYITGQHSTPRLYMRHF
jgi:hypothetical protein